MEFKVGDRVMAVGTVKAVPNDSARVQFDGGIEGEPTWMYTSELRPIDPNPIICDPNSPEAQALVGKTVLMGDYWNEVGRVTVLMETDTGRAFPFCTAVGNYKFIRAITEKPIKKITIAEATAMLTEKLGIQVEIVKEE